VSPDQIAGRNRDKKIGNRSFESVSQFKYLGTTVTNQQLILEEIKWRLNSGNACYHSVQYLLSSRLLSKNVQITIYKTIKFPVVLYGYETCSLILRLEHRLWVFDNRCWGEYLDQGEMKRRESGENCITRSFMISTLRQVQLELSNQGRRIGQDMELRWGKAEAYGVLVGKSDGKWSLCRPRRRWVKILQWIL
jgi:hypothetical protein